MAKQNRPKLPKSVKIGARVFELRYLSTFEEDLGDVFGVTMTTHDLIGIADHMALGKEAQVVVHEIFHGIAEVFGLTDDDKEEQMVNQMSLGWVAVMADNPDVVTYLGDALTWRS